MKRRQHAAVSILALGLMLGACGVETPQVGGFDAPDPVTTTVATVGNELPSTAAPTTRAPATTTSSTTTPITTRSSESLTVTTPPASTEPPEPDAPVTTQPPETGVIAPALEQLVQIAIADLASRLGVAGGDITVISAEMVVWPDSSLGCPQPGMAYTQVLVDGFRILLAARGEVHAYHGGGTKGPFLCENPQP